MNVTGFKKLLATGFQSIMLGLLAGTLTAGMAITAKAEDSNAVKVKAALKVMQSEAAKLGDPKLEGLHLLFGTTKINGDYTIVDALQQQFNCTATFFAKKGTDFIRISTNVLNDGNRAVGTVLNPKGEAFAAITKGEPFYGTVDILGKQYEAGYEPVKNTAGEIIGVFYVGFLLP